MRNTLTALAAGTAIAGFGAFDVQAQQVLRIQSSFPPASYTHENLVYFAGRVEAMSGGQLRMELLPAGAVVPAFEVLDAVDAGVVDGGHTAPAYWVGRHRAAALFGPTPGGPYGFDMIDYMGWINDGGGQELYEEFYQEILGRDIHPLPLTSLADQPLGWFDEEITSWEDLEGKRCRHTGLTAEVFEFAGVSAVNIPGGEIVPAGERGVIECAEFISLGEDARIGFATVWNHFHAPSTHEPATVVELILRKSVWDGLDDNLQEIIRTATRDATLMSQITINRANAEAMAEAEETGLNLHRTPDDIMIRTLEAWEEIAEREREADEFFARVMDSQREYASLIVPSRRFNDVPYDLAADYYWGENGVLTNNAD